MECPVCAHFKKAIELAFTALTIAESQEEAGFNDAGADLETLMRETETARERHRILVEKWGAHRAAHVQDALLHME